MKKQIIIILLALSCNSCGIIAFVVPFNDLPKPTGPFSVGTQIFEWQDNSREEWFTQDSADFRRLVIQIWYPTNDVGFDYLPYIDHPEVRTNTIAEQLNLPKYFIKHIKNVKSNAILNAALFTGASPLPIIIFSHGLGGMRMQNSVQIEELASRGYFVLSMDHAYDANITVFADGSMADYRSGVRGGLTEDEFWEVRLPQLNTRAADISYILNKIELLQKQGINQWKDVDIDRVGVFGHSFGGSSSIVASFNDSRIDACLNLDGWIVPVESKIIHRGLSIPFLFIGQETWKDSPLNYTKLDSLIRSSGGDKKLIHGTKHMAFTDTPQFSPIATKIGISGSLDMHSIRQAINAHTLMFFDKNVKGIK